MFSSSRCPTLRGVCRRPPLSRFCFSALIGVESFARCAVIGSSFTATSRLAGVSTPSAAAADSRWAVSRRGPPNGDRVVVAVRTPGVDTHVDTHRVRMADDRNYDVLTVRKGNIVAVHACRDREEALSAAGLG